jgi:Alpha amylase, catalytic domain
MEFHISRAVREAAQVDDLLFSYSGNVVFANVAASRKLADALNKARGPNADPAGAYNAGALFAMGLIDELSHALVARYRKEIDPTVLSEAVRWFTAQIESQKLERLLLTFTEQFPNVAVFRGQITATKWLTGTTEGVPNREVALEELLLLWIANLNPAFKPFQTLFEDASLKQQTVYTNVTAAFPNYFSTRPPIAEIGTLFEALRAPMLASPDSLTGQLDFIREKWAPYLGEDLKRILLAIDVLREEDLAIWMRFHPPGPDQYRHGAPEWGSMGFVGDEFIGYDEFKRKKYAAGYQAPLDEYENFSADQAWMPNVVLMAKSTYVWLEQLSKKYLRHIHRLDQIPDEELHLLADRGVTGLWLIGLWERSVASRTIKRLRGHHDAVASAYSLKSYDIAEDLGGWTAYETLKHRAANAGLRLASDMVPNHMGIDSPWVIEHPDWFVHRWESPFPAYSFNGPDLSTDSRVEIKIDDHYYDQTDAAVAFRLRHHSSNETRYVYHGNDGTTFAWNDTAQLDYSKAYVREHVIQTILHVARMFPIIRFDAAMVLAKRHVQRLWFPLPGAGGSIPSRAENSMSQEEFDALMPHEFWREVVDRVAAEVPGTLLLAEAFWLLEGYFVRTLGMHRVYNSAFMNMLRDEENAKYRSYLKKTIEFDPDILKRYVNFMSNPDERTAIDQFGSSDKYFGVCTLLATLPGLPMFGHGQIEGFTERYGMEFKQARMNEWPNEDLVARHQREIAPLLKKRYIFAGSSSFTLYDFWNGFGHVDENVFAYSNRFHGERSLVLYNNKYDSTHGTIHISAGFMDKGSGQMRQRSLADGLGLPTSDSLIIRYRDTNGLEYLRRATDIHWHGLTFELRGFQCVCLLDWHELRSTAEYPWEWLCDTLRGAGVANLDQELTRLRLRPLHDTLRQAISPNKIQVLATIACEREPGCRPGNGAGAKLPAAQGPSDPRLQPLVEKSQTFFDKLLENIPDDLRAAIKPHAAAISAAAPKAPAAPTYADTVRELASAATLIPFLAQSFSTDWPAEARRMLPGRKPGTQADHAWAPVLAWIVLRSLPLQNDVTLFDRLEIRSALADIFVSLGMEGEAKWRAAAQVRMLLSAPAASVRSEKFWSDPDTRWLAGVNTSAGVTYINREQFEELLAWLQLPALIKIAQQKSDQAKSIAELEAAFASTCEAAHDAGYRLDAFLNPAKPQPAALKADAAPKADR